MKAHSSSVIGCTLSRAFVNIARLARAPSKEEEQSEKANHFDLQFKIKFGTFGSLVLEMIVLELLEGDVPLERANILHIHHRPLGILLAALRVVVRVLLVELGVVDVGFLHHFHNSNYPRHLRVAVVEERLLTSLCRRMRILQLSF